jgi:hypothetical protein
MHPKGLTVANGREFVFLCKSGRVPTGRPKLVHAVPPNYRIALCSTEPGAGSDWSEPSDNYLTCSICRIRLDRLGM